MNTSADYHPARASTPSSDPRTASAL